MTCTLALAALLAKADTTGSAKQNSSASAAHHVTGKHKKSHRTTARKRGQQKIDAQRAHQIQEALIREHYLTGKPSGTWDAATQAAMQKYQADNGWQSKTTPDSRALIKLGLGPDHDHLLNPESAMTSQPAAHSAPASDPTAPAQPQK
jgi:hypothetical protein